MLYLPSASTVKVTGDLQHRFCLSIPRSEIRSYTCQDAGPYRDVVQRIISSIFDLVQELKLEGFNFHGGICLCQTANCNIDLPKRSLFTMPPGWSTTPRGTKSSSSPSLTPGMAAVFVLSLCSYIIH